MLALVADLALAIGERLGEAFDLRLPLLERVLAADEPFLLAPDLRAAGERCLMVVRRGGLLRRGRAQAPCEPRRPLGEQQRSPRPPRPPRSRFPFRFLSPPPRGSRRRT
jgi:hypothetical protein